MGRALAALYFGVVIGGTVALLYAIAFIFGAV